MKHLIFTCMLLLLSSCTFFDPNANKNKLTGARHSVFNDVQHDNVATRKCNDSKEIIKLADKKKISAFQTIGVTNKPLIIQDKIIFLDSGKIYAYDLDLKRLLWERKLNGINNRSITVGKITEFDGILYVTYGINKLIAIDSQNGHQLWITELDDIVKGRVAVSDNLVFLQSAHNSLYGINKETGKIIWRHIEISDQYSGFADFTPIVYGDDVLFQITNSEIIALDINDGTEKKVLHFGDQYSIKNADATQSIPNHFFIKDGIIYAHSKDMKLVAIHYQTQKELWRSQFIADTKFLVHQDKIYFMTDHNRLAAINTEDGKGFYLVDLSTCSKKKMKYNKWTRPVLYKKDTLLVTNYDGEMMEIELATGNIKSKADSMEFITSSPAVFKDLIYVISNNGNIYKYQ